jgi:ABC-2 type transport system ATP-binding protein
VPSVHLVVVEGPDTGREFEITARSVVGRDPSVDIVIGDAEASGRHAAVAVDGDGLTVEDLGSTNGTFVNGERITGPRRLAAGERVRFGTTVLEARGAAAPPPPPAAAPQELRETIVRRIPTVPVLVFVGGTRDGTTVPVGRPVVVGRDHGAADVVLADDADVSRRHAVFAPAGAGLTVLDLGSTNGTFVNGHRLDYAVTLATGDRVQLGDTIIEVLLAEQPAAAPPAAPVVASPFARDATPNDVLVEGLVKAYGNHRAVDGINLHVQPGEIYGFLGPNGAGKSTTVHMLTTLLPPTSGTARIAGYDVVRQGADVRRSIGVALQAAALDPTLNAWEHMDLQTALQGLPKSKRRARGAELLERVGLTDAADRRVGGYSGGMKRRLDLALALVHWPRVLFLDEPTTGLDPQSRIALWEEVARLVKEEGMTVFLTTQYLEEADIMADRVGIIAAGEIVAEDTPSALKEQIGRPTVEVVPLDSAQWNEVSQVLGRFGELVSATNKGVAVRLRPGIDDLADVIRALDAARLRVANVQLHAPTLDDVFLAKTGRSLEGAGGQPDPEQDGVLDQLGASGVPGVVSAA